MNAANFLSQEFHLSASLFFRLQPLSEALEDNSTQAEAHPRNREESTCPGQPSTTGSQGLVDKYPRLLTFSRMIPRCILGSSSEVPRKLRLSCHRGDWLSCTFSIGFCSSSIPPHTSASRNYCHINRLSQALLLGETT